MRLTIKNIHLYLLDKGFIDLQSLVDGDYIATQGQTRNLIFKITRKKAKSLFIKQLNSFDQNNTYVLQKDATCLWLIKNNPAYKQLSDYVPEYFGFDPEKQVLITEYLKDSINLEDYIRINGDLSKKMIEELAHILTSYHFTIDEEIQHSRSVQFFPKQIPWVLNLMNIDPTANSSLFSNSQSSNPVLNAVIGNAEFKRVLAGIKETWLYNSLIHGDIKWLNLLIHKEDDQEKIKIIDWEIADIGDPLWDVAGIFQGLISSILLYGNNTAEPFNFVPGIGLDDIKEAWPKIRYFWRHYLNKRSSGQEAADIALEKSIKYTGARLIQTAMEQNMMMPTLQPIAIKLLQASYAILNNVPEVISQVSSSKTLITA